MPKLWQSVKNFFTGTPEKHKRVSTLRPDQEPLYDQLKNAAMQSGAGGAFGESADYYRDVLSDDSQTAQMMFAPEMRRFNEEIIPGLSEQFAGMGSGGLSSSGFRNAAINAGTDLSERLGAIRANLRSQAASGLSGIGQQALGNYSQDVMTQPGTPGLLGSLSNALGNAAGQYAGNWLTGGQKSLKPPPTGNTGGNNVGANTSPYGVSKFNPPSFNPNLR